MRITFDKLQKSLRLFLLIAHITCIYSGAIRRMGHEQFVSFFIKKIDDLYNV